MQVCINLQLDTDPELRRKIKGPLVKLSLKKIILPEGNYPNGCPMAMAPP